MPIDQVTDAAIQRLKKSKADFEATTRGTGLAAGLAWATGHADYDDLRTLACSQIEDDERMDSGEDAAYAVACAAWGMELESDAPFWEYALPDGDLSAIGDPEFVKGFVDGARQVWAAVKGKL